MPLSLFPEIANKDIGTDVTKELHITYASIEDQKRKSNGISKEDRVKSMKSKHQKLFKNSFIKRMMKYEWFRNMMLAFLGKKDDKYKWPVFIVKTDENRCENSTWVLFSKDPWIKTEKIDGTSTSAFVNFKHRIKPDFGVCSRNVRQHDPDQKNYHSDVNGIGNVYWEMALKYDFKKALIDIAKKEYAKQVVLQGETYGEGIQGNPYKMDHRDFAAFNLIVDGERLNSEEAKEILAGYGIPFVPIVDNDYFTPTTMEELKLEADGKSLINPQVKREGFVYRSLDGKQSFKNVSRDYLLSHGG